MCAPCSPAQGAIFALEALEGFPVAVLQTCQSFCDRLFDACGSATMLLAERPPDRVDALFRDGGAFCGAVGLRVAEQDERGEQCFSSASRGQRVSAVAWLAVAAGLVVLRSVHADERSSL